MLLSLSYVMDPANTKKTRADKTFISGTDLVLDLRNAEDVRRLIGRVNTALGGSRFSVAYTNAAAYNAGKIVTDAKVGKSLNLNTNSGQRRFVAVVNDALSSL